MSATESCPVIAVDLGGTNLRVAVIDGDGTVLERHRVPTPTQGSITDSIAELIAELGADPDYPAVVAVPGLVDYERRSALWAPHLPPDWVTELAEDHLTSRLCRRVCIANDADLAAVGETYFGAGRNAGDVAFLTVSTGIGAGVLLNRRLVRGRRSVAEIGHTIIDRHALSNGEPATLEELASGSNIPRLAQIGAVRARTGEQLEALEESGDDRATAVWMQIVESVTIGIINLAWCFGPDLIIIGGGIGRERPLLDPVRERLNEMAPIIAMKFALVKEELADDAGLIGAAAWDRANTI
ncbi:MAG: ROK family protein [Acidimicrobiales bacterium]|jgi:glucokinase